MQKKVIAAMVALMMVATGIVILEMTQESDASATDGLAAAICFAIVNISVTVSTKARDVSFTSVIISLVTAGSTRLMTCGKIILKNV